MILTSVCFMLLLQHAAGMINTSYIFLLSHHPSIQVEILNKHNDLRRMVKPSARNMLKMTWNAEVAKNAETWAKKCIFSHSPNDQRKINFAGCGENYFLSSDPRTWSNVIQSLYDEVKDFKYGLGNIRANAKTGHYTQLVWATSHQLGCALAHCPHKKYKYFYVCQYCPAGNDVRKMKTPYKTGKPCGDCPGHCDNGLCKDFNKFKMTLAVYSYGRVGAKIQSRCLMYALHLLLCLVSVLHDSIQQEWKSQAAKSAQSTTEKCKMENSSPDKREEDGKSYGENKFKSPNAVSWEYVVSEWIKQKVNFFYGIGAISPEASVHSYVQVIWYNSYEIGCGVAHCPSDEYFYVCHYCPSGYNPGLIFAHYDEGSECGHCQNDCSEGLRTNPCRYDNKGDNCDSLLDKCGDEEVHTTCEATCKCINNEIL
ncbi:cysteine-rich venom protein pseudechetoxin-like [Fukomys damarensis]|uniref:cysteine-rich venom protein pseudechetoxin-like n=1 Tax=Fukomys damarensis TaxID=885580 RepID=UPI0005401924|nr:cysteine-rich venom protein pseudechetoxin-like [Fukomys damarensis]